MKSFDGVCHHYGKKGHMSRGCPMKKNKKKENEKAERAVDGDNEEFILCQWMLYFLFLQEKYLDW